MRDIAYGPSHIVTTEEISDGVLAYAAALARSHSADTVQVPSLEADGQVHLVDVLIGPASQITSSDLARDAVEMPAADLLADLQQRTRLLDSSHAVPMETATDEDFAPDLPDLTD
ncbi:MAG: hypothetical protein JWR33_280 [Naasia sp.]|jgi:hypothetical protein|uniref:hypothetical protein n=1 Tax=Naasia sp. TaxID=2546198 RepID=UPI00261DAF54|nr:hypothetical protein [Naasia sp.]MCU1569539.1 hypothetical protein [Naasia sp.]